MLSLHFVVLPTLKPSLIFGSNMLTSPEVLNPSTDSWPQSIYHSMQHLFLEVWAITCTKLQIARVYKLRLFVVWYILIFRWNIIRIKYKIKIWFDLIPFNYNIKFKSNFCVLVQFSLPNNYSIILFQKWFLFFVKFCLTYFT